MNVKISNALMSAAPSNDWIRSTVSERLKHPLPPISYPPMSGRISFYVGKEVARRILALASETGRRPNEIFTSCLIDVLGDRIPDGRKPTVPALLPKAPRIKPGERQVDPVSKPPKTPSKKQAAWLQGLEERRAIIRADIAVGRWGVFSITGGNPAVKPNAPLDEQGVRDFDDEIQQGVVVQEIIPWEYNHEEAMEWLRKRNREGKPLSWYYISGDSESLNDVQESRRRGELRADKRFPEMVSTLAQVEHEEALERQVFGHKRYYLEWATRDRDRLLVIGRRDGIPKDEVVPKNLAKLVEKAESKALLMGGRILKLARDTGAQQ